MITILKKSKFVNIVVSVAIKKDKKYLLVKEAKERIVGLWNFPAGKVEFGESLFVAARREAKEETGYDCEINGLTGVYFFYWDDMPGLTVRFNFLGKIISDKQNALADDISETSWFTIKEIKKMDLEKKLRGKPTISQYRELEKDVSYPETMIKEI